MIKNRISPNFPVAGEILRPAVRPPGGLDPSARQSFSTLKNPMTMFSDQYSSMTPAMSHPKNRTPIKGKRLNRSRETVERLSETGIDLKGMTVRMPRAFDGFMGVGFFLLISQSFPRVNHAWGAPAGCGRLFWDEIVSGVRRFFFEVRCRCISRRQAAGRMT